MVFRSSMELSLIGNTPYMAHVMMDYNVVAFDTLAG
jgi:hypothetical protein